MRRGSKTDVVLVYPFFMSEQAQQRQYIYPQLGLGSIATVLRRKGISAAVVDGTFSSRKEVISRIEEHDPRIVGIYSKVTISDAAIGIARELRGRYHLVAGGPHASCLPEEFSNHFDVVVRREGEITMAEIAERILGGNPYRDVAGISFRADGEFVSTPERGLVKDLDSLPMTDHRIFENGPYQEYWRNRFGVSCGSVITARGCPYRCEYCSKEIFGDSYRASSLKRVVDEIRQVLELGYDEIWFADDAFSLHRKRTEELCRAILAEGLRFSWTCLCRVDNLDKDLLLLMKEAGCRGIIFGIESLDDGILKIMDKRFDVAQATSAIALARSAGLVVNSYFMVGYKGDTDGSILKTVNLSSRLPFSFLQYAIPKPLPGTRFAKRVSGEIGIASWNEWQKALTWKADFSERKLRFAIRKGNIQFQLRSRFGIAGRLLAGPFQWITDVIFRYAFRAAPRR